MIVCIAEKPSVARDIARIIGATSSHDIKTCCDDIDTLASLVNADSLGVEIDDVEMTITINIECDEIVMESRQHKLYEIAGKAAEVKFAVSQEDQNKLLICFVFPGIWKHV